MSISLALPPGPAQPVPADGVGRLLRQLDASLDDAVEAAVTWSLTDRLVHDRLGQALAVRARVDELIDRLTSQVHSRDLAETHGASSTRAYLIAEHHMSAAAAAATVTAARAMTPRTHTTRTAWAAGLLSAEQASVIGTAVNRLDRSIPDHTMAAAQADLVCHAQTLTHRELRTAAAHLVEVVDPDGADQQLSDQLDADETRALQQARFRATKGADGLARFSGRIPNLHYDMLTSALEAIAAPRRTPTDETAAVTDAVTAADGTQPGQLPYATRMGRAFCDLLEHLPTDQLPQHGVANATVVITLDFDTLLDGLGEATLSTGEGISASEARRLACNAGLIPAVLDSQFRMLDLGTSRRLFDRHQRLALALRDQGCVFPGCDRPPAWTEAHHLCPASRGGPTDLANGCLLCPFHHHLIHRTDWQIIMATDGIPEAIPPPDLDPTRTPGRHARFRPSRE